MVINNNAIFPSLLQSIILNVGNYNEPLDILKTALNYKALEVDREHTYNIYKIRMGLAYLTNLQKVEYSKVIEALLNYNGDRILIHTFKVDNGVLLFFTSTDCSEIFGYISSMENSDGLSG